MDKFIGVLNGGCEKTIRALVEYNGYLYSGGDDYLILKWYNDECIKVLNGCEEGVQTLIVHNEYLFSGDSAGKIRKWKDDVCIKVLHGHDAKINSMILHDGHLYSSDDDCQILKWFDDGYYIRISSKKTRGAVECLVSYRDKNNKCYLYSGDTNGVISKWEDDICIQHIYTNSTIWCIAIHDDYIYTGHADQLIRKWTNTCAEEPIILHQHKSYVLTLISFNECLYSCGLRKLICKWNNDKCVQVIRTSDSSPYYFINHNEAVYVACYDGVIRKYGEYWPNQYRKLPQTQKEKIKNWRRTKLGIQKDLKFLFERELLSE